MIIDAHHHLLDPERMSYPWLTEKLGAVRRRFWVVELEAELARHAVAASIAVQARTELSESYELLRAADEHEVVAGVVGWVDVTAPDVSRVLADLEHPSLVGVRHPVHDEPDPAWLTRADVQRGLRAVAGAGLVFDLLIRPRELDAALLVVRAHPELRFVLDHLAKPRVDGRLDTRWQAGLAALSDIPNVWCKLSGLVTEAHGQRWRAGQLADYMKRAIGWFGAERCMFGSDWPVCLLAASYSEVVDVVELALADRTPAERSSVLAGTALAAYRLPEPPGGALATDCSR
jgi:L-fuconolactonase